jgi:hypothetical protein
MPWTSPPTYSTGQLVTAATANAQWRDNLNLLATSIETATGRLSGEIKNHREDLGTLTIAANAITLDLSLRNAFYVQLTANITSITVSNWVNAKQHLAALRLQQDGTGGRTVTFPAGWKWDGGTALAVPSGANKTCIVTLYSDDGGTSIFPQMYNTNA